MSEEFKSNMSQNRTGKDLNRNLWIQHAQRVVYFSPKEGFEIKEFDNQGDLMDYARACVSSGYYIG